MKKKSLFAALFAAIILISSCVMGVPENESASISFKIKATAASRSTATDTLNNEGYIVVSIEDAGNGRVLASQTLPGTATSFTFSEIQVGLTIIGKVQFFDGADDKKPYTLTSRPHTVTYGDNILIVDREPGEDPSIDVNQFIYDGTTYEIGIKQATTYTYHEAMEAWGKPNSEGWYLPSIEQLGSCL